MVEHYFIKEPKSELKINKVKTILRNKFLEFYTASGLFSIKKVDIGTELLINKCLIKERDKILDLGCGYGIIGLTLLLTIKNLELIFSDINERAIKITKMNLEKYKLKAQTIHSDGFENIRENFNVILLNPPQTAGKELCLKLIESSYAYLKDKGTLQIVARHNKGGKTLSIKMNKVFGNIKEIAKSSGYRIYLSKK